GQAWLERQARVLAPAIARARPASRWAGLRPGTPDGLPVVGPSSEARGLLHATGHFRNGVLLAAVTADLVHDALHSPGEPVEPAFDPARFATVGGPR
nr:FAD-dependent oxidoreductase [Gemmatimonadota bacterium]